MPYKKRSFYDRILLRGAREDQYGIYGINGWPVNRGVMKAKCFQCKHFYISWDQNFPRGCRAYKFTSERLPSVVVKESSGADCQLFAQKKKKPTAKMDLNDDRFWKA